MPTAQELLDALCADCKNEGLVAFGTPRPPPMVINSDLFYTGCCFVHDEIHFVDRGRLIFQQTVQPNRETGYCKQYIVACRKLVIRGGGTPPRDNPCSAGDPGTEYRGLNLISWDNRLRASSDGGTKSPQAPAANHDTNNWTDYGGDNRNGAQGADGTHGELGEPGGMGRPAPPRLIIIALEVEVAPRSNLIVDWGGQPGGRGGPGQDGGDGGDGMGGRPSQHDTDWLANNCERQAGDGGNGGRGGNGGKGGTGGGGGRGGELCVVAPAPLITGSGPFVNGEILLLIDGGSGGGGGASGRGARGGRGGRGGRAREAPCTVDGRDGQGGAAGDPGSAAGTQANGGDPGLTGQAGTVAREAWIRHPCSDPIPLPMRATALQPARLLRDDAAPASIDAVLTGSNLLAVTSVATNLAGVTAALQPTGHTDTELPLRISATANSALGAAELTLNRPFGSAVSLANALSVEAMRVTSAAPNALGAGGPAVNLVLTGTGFDETIAIEIEVSGNAATVHNPAVVSPTQASCQLELGANAADGPRNVTVRQGPALAQRNHTAVGALTVNSGPAITITQVAPATGARGSSQLVTITGTGFTSGPAGANLVNVSGAGVNVSGAVVVNATTITATFAVTGLAAMTARDVTVTLGTRSAVANAAFTVA